MWLVEQLMGQMQYLEHINITSSQEEINRQANKTKKGNKIWIHHLKGDLIQVTITLNRTCNW